MAHDISKLNLVEKLAFENATPLDALKLWQERNIAGYHLYRETVLNAEREGHVNKLDVHELQFVHFIETHLRPRVHGDYGECMLFLKRFPAEEVREIRQAVIEAWC